MKIYISKDGKQIGPYTTEEARDLVYRGELLRSDLACQDGLPNWVPLDKLLSSTTPPPPSSAISRHAPLAIDQLRDPREKAALIWLSVAAVPVWLVLILWIASTLGVGLLIIGLILLFKRLGELWFAAYLKTNGVRVSEVQLPDLNRIVRTCCQKLDIAQPAIYVLQQNIWNAFAIKLLGQRMVVLLSGALDSLLLKGDLQQVAWLVGHELGHHAAGHLDFKRKLASLGGWLVWLQLWYSRRAEFTCDRIGLYCADSLKASQLALVNATVGAQLANQVNVNEAVAQWNQHRKEFFVRYRTLYSSHPHHLCRLERLAAAAAELDVPG